MTQSAHLGLEHRLDVILAAGRLPVLVGGCGSGRTTALHGLADRLGRSACQYVDIERAASTPERFYRALLTSSPFHDSAGAQAVTRPSSAREAFDQTLAFLSRAHTATGETATFLLDEVLELRTFESFPGLRHVQHELLQALAESPNRFVLSSRYVSRAHRLLRDAAPRFEMVHAAALSPSEAAAMLPPMGEMTQEDREALARTIHALADGRVVYVRALAEATAAMSGRGGDPVSALTALLASEGTLASWCAHRYELRLQHARGYGALKAILEILAEDEPLTLTEIALRLQRTPGSTKDYLSWLEDVDLVTVRQKRYTVADPLLRLWVRLHARPEPPGVDAVAREVQAYAATRLPHGEPSLALSAATGERRWGIIEID